MADKNPLAVEELFGHVQDSPDFHVPVALAPEHHGHIAIPQPFESAGVHWIPRTGIETIDKLNLFEPLDLVITKFMVLEVVAALLVLAAMWFLAARLRWGGPPRGRWWNAIESVLLFIRDEVARPAIGKHDADRFLPFLWTMFFFVLACNLLGMVPWLGSATGAFATTAALALCTFLVVVGTGVAKMGPIGFLKAQVPHMDLPAGTSFIFIPMIFLIEIFGFLIKHFVLAVRLMANMLAGHVVLAVLVAFVSVTAHNLYIFAGVAPVSVLSAVAISLLELFVAFLQAYIFTFLSALFIGSAVHPH